MRQWSLVSYSIHDKRGFFDKNADKIPPMALGVDKRGYPSPRPLEGLLKIIRFSFVPAFCSLLRKDTSDDIPGT